MKKSYHSSTWYISLKNLVTIWHTLEAVSFYALFSGFRSSLIIISKRRKCFLKEKIFPYLFPMLWRFSDQERTKHVSNLFCTHHIVFNNIYKMRKEWLPQFNQRRFHEGSGETKKDNSYTWPKPANTTVLKALYARNSKQLTVNCCLSTSVL